MKNLSFIQKIVFFLNLIAALSLLLAFVSVYLPENFLPALSLLSLIFPVIVLVNILFALYWIVSLKKEFLISLFVLLLNYYNLQAIYQFNGKHPIEKKGFSLMSYNVRLFNRYDWIKQKAVDVSISNYIKDRNPDILFMQEFYNNPHTDFSQYKYKHIVVKGKKFKMGLAIFSKYKILKAGDINFQDTFNNAVWCDVLIQNDTIRLYNVHLQSHNIINPGDLANQNKSKLSHKLQKAFGRQKNQAKKIQTHINQSGYMSIVGGDFNSTAFSSAYHILKNNKTDAFVAAGDGFGITWKYKFVPMRIDFILADDRLDAIGFETLNHINYSDHFPVKANFVVHRL